MGIRPGLSAVQFLKLGPRAHRIAGNQHFLWLPPSPPAQRQAVHAATSLKPFGFSCLSGGRATAGQPRPATTLSHVSRGSQ